MHSVNGTVTPPHKLSVYTLLFVSAAALFACSPASTPAPSQPPVVQTPVPMPPTNPPTPPAPPQPIPPETPPAVPTVQSYTYQVVHTYPHDPAAFTEGLVYDNGFLYEGTGLEGKSSLRRVQLETGSVVQSMKLSPLYFGEGVTIVGDRIIQLTWQSHMGFVYDKNSFQFLRDFTYTTDGWGITYDGKQLIMSDGTPTLYFLDPETFTVTGRVMVYDRGSPVPMLNELEYINGQVYANIWPTNRIAIIDPRNGRVTGWIDLTGLIASTKPAGQVDVPNGIAYDAANDRLFVTGKLWPWLFEIKLVKRQ